MPAHHPLSGRRYLIPLVQAASLSAGATGCLGGALQGEWTLVEVDGKDADLFSSTASGGHSVEPQPYAYGYGYYGYAGDPDHYSYGLADGAATADRPPAGSIRLPVRSPSEGPSGSTEVEGCDQKLGLELSLDIDERDGDDYEGEAEGGVVHTLVCDGTIESRDTRRQDGDVEGEAQGKGRYEVEVDLGRIELELDCEVDGSELDCDVDDADLDMDQLLFERTD